VEVPNLSVSSIWCLDDHISIVDQVKVSVIWQLRNDVEWSLNKESKLLVKLSFLRFTLPFVNVHDVPLLPEAILLFVYTNVSLFSINVSDDFQDLSFLVDN
jgi:hypothetical protein